MYRPSSSYFVTISGDESTVAAAAAAMETRSISPDYLTCGCTEPDARHYEVLEGSMDRWNDVDEVLATLARDFPTLTINAKENCEEPCFPSREMRFRGEDMEVRYGRILAPDEYDAQTIGAAMKLLRGNGMNEAADLVLSLVDAREEEW